MLRFSIIKSSFNFTCNNNGVLSSLLSHTFSTIISKSTNSSTDYLMNSLGLSELPESALRRSNQICLKFNSKADSVLDLFKNYGFSKSHIANIFTRYPCLLLADPNKNLKPKFDFLSKAGISGRHLVEIISSDPSILKRSLEKQIIPCFAFLNSLYGTCSDIVSLFSVKRGTWILHKFSKEATPNVATLRRYGVPDSSIKKIIIVRPRTLARECCEFDEFVREIRDMGFDPESGMFFHAVCTRAGMKKEKWMSKLKIFKSFGWTEQQIQALVLKQPKIMDTSEEKMKTILEFAINILKWNTDDIFKYPTILISSFEKRLLPRFSVVEVLITRGFVDKKSIGKALLMPDGNFLSSFVLNYQAQIPQIFEMYQSKMDITRHPQLVASV